MTNVGGRKTAERVKETPLYVGPRPEVPEDYVPSLPGLVLSRNARIVGSGMGMERPLDETRRMLRATGPENRLRRHEPVRAVLRIVVSTRRCEGDEGVPA